MAIAELDSGPGGIGLTAWLNQTYARFGTYDILGRRYNFSVTYRFN